MRQNPSFLLSDRDDIKQLIRENPWATIVSSTSSGELVASHYPVVLDENEEDVVVFSHVGRPDDLLHELGEHEILMIVQGPHGYISPGWYDADPAVPTWNFVTVHLSGTPEILSPTENLRALADLVDRFEEVLPDPRRMEGTPEDAAYAARISSGTVGFRLRPTRIVAKRKMSQNKPAAIVDRVLAELDGDGPYSSAPLAREMRRARREPGDR
ncbi:negative transcriptional regulator, PaiB family [Rathayibacter oskolensis]|uniref:Negative transcriptional regulator, PaiB family n=1 Tax=Rathayibacter oskolensis TaxID=1891671 RepID=A0A1X7NID2_9MICO|nr:FMN-binding negative transcriptional regulator [Rathayibacter oskolensis]SMH37591.1 negative transcriptional regulator, PaiB family [Rathayibacter oskolensis]